LVFSPQVAAAERVYFSTLVGMFFGLSVTKSFEQVSITESFECGMDLGMSSFDVSLF
jgi:hypothetical protein